MFKIEEFIRHRVQHYDPKKYWKYREAVVNETKGNKLSKIFKLYYIKRCDAFNTASMGTHINYGAKFLTPPKLPHGLNGIIVAHNAIIGSDCTIFHQVTIGCGRGGGAPTIGNNVMIGAGAKIIGGIKIGDNVKIGAGCVVFEDIPDNATVVLPKPRIIINER